MSIEYSWCPECKKWVPRSTMNYDVMEDGSVFRVCSACMEGLETDYVSEPEHESVKCVFCLSTNVVELAPIWNKYRCNSCEEIFWRL